MNMTNYARHLRPLDFSVLLGTLLTLGVFARPDAKAQDIQVAELKFTEAFRIGEDTATDTVLFGSISNVAANSQGMLFVSEFRQPRVRVFSPVGVPVKELGREGRGPGEFRWAPSLFVGPKDTLYAWDLMQRRLTLFSPPDYSFHSAITVSVPEGSIAGPHEFMGATDNGLLIGFLPPRTADDPQELLTLQTIVVDRNGQIAKEDAVAQLPYREELVQTMNNLVSGWGLLPFGRASRFAFGFDRQLYYAWNEAIDITAVNWEGAVQRSISVPHEPVTLTQAEREAAIADAPEEYREDIRARLPGTKPAFVSLLVDDSARLWIELSRPEGAEEARWLVIGDTGTVVGGTSLPVNYDISVVRNGRAYGRIRDPETRVQMVAVWDIGE